MKQGANHMTTKASDTQVGGEHYRTMGDFQPWDVLQHWLTPDEYRGYQKGVAIAYLARERQKGSDQDIKKAAHHLQRLLEALDELPVSTEGSAATGASMIAELQACNLCCGDFESCTKPCVPRVIRLSGKNGWIEWAGGECPVPVHVLVTVERRDGNIVHRQAGLLDWTRNMHKFDIVRFAVAENRPAQLAPEQRP